jgi:type I restriction enzyme S subunit
MPVRVPAEDEQRVIAHVLGTLDDKIELNQRMNETMEAIAQALYKSLFVDTTQNGLPEGWRESTIGDEVRVVGGSTPSTKEAKFWEGGTNHWATPKDLSTLESPVLLHTERRITDAALAEISSGLLPHGTVLLSSRAPIGYLVISEIEVAVNQGFIAMVCDKQLPNYYVRLWTRANMNLIKANANGTTFLEISKSNFRPLPVVVPPKSVLDDFVRRAEPFHQRIASNLRESATLGSLRDTLLPKLLSGEVRVSSRKE